MEKNKKTRIHATIEDGVYQTLQAKKEETKCTESDIVSRTLKIGFFLEEVTDRIEGKLSLVCGSVDSLVQRIKSLRDSDLFSAAFSKEAEAQIKKTLGEQRALLLSLFGELNVNLNESLKQIVTAFSSIESMLQKTNANQDHYTKVLVQFSEGLQRLQGTLVKGVKA